MGKFLPLVIFIALAWFLFDGLGRDTKKLPSPLIGKSFPNIEVEDFSTKEKYTTHSLLKGNITLVNVWASWCSPCRLEHPIILRLSRHKDLNIFGINYKDKKKNAISYLNKFGNPYKKIGLDLTGFLSVDLGFFGVPETILINKDEKILLKFVGPLNENDYNKIVSRIRE